MSHIIEYSNQEIPQLLELLTSTTLTEQAEHHLTIYLSTPPKNRRGPDAKQPWQIELRQQLDAELSKALLLDRAMHQQLESRLLEIQGAIDELCEPYSSGNSRVLFTSLEKKADIHILRTQMELPTSVHVNSRAAFAPLLSIADEGRIAGAVLINEREAQFWRIFMGETTLMKRLDYKELALPALETDQATGGKYEESRNSILGQFHSRARAVPAGRLAEHRKKFIHLVAKTLPAVLSGDRLVLVGDPRDLNYLRVSLSKATESYICENNQHLLSLSAIDISTRLNECLAELNQQREEDLVLRARENALAGDKGALGCDAVFAALAQQRARLVVFDASHRYSGYVDNQTGEILTDKNGHTNVRKESDLIEHLWRACHQSGASLIPVEGIAAKKMQEHDGIAALLYW